MSALRCPGVTGYGRADAVTHQGGCCAAFALMSPERRQKVGLRTPLEPQQLLGIEDHPDPEPISIGELIETVRLLQLAADEGMPAPVSLTPTALIDHDFPQEQLDALLQLGEAYGLNAHCIRRPAPH